MALANQPYVCQYCKKGFMKEGTLFVHICEQKRRALAKTEKHVLVGYDTYNRFYKTTQQSKVRAQIKLMTSLLEALTTMHLLNLVVLLVTLIRCTQTNLSTMLLHPE